MFAGGLGVVLGKPVDEETEEFVHRTIDSFATWDVMVFFHNRQGFSGDTAAVAGHLGRSESDILRSLERLLDCGIVTRCADDGLVMYAYDPDSDLAKQVDRFTAALQHREKRLALLAGLLRRGIR